MLVALVVFALAACSDPAANPDAGDDLDAGIDAPGCDPDRPFTRVPEALVGPQASPIGLEQRILSAIDTATQSIDVQMYTFTLTNVADRLIAADRRGVPVRVILDGNQTVNAAIRTRLTNGGVAVTTAPAGFLNAHAKYLVADGTRAIILSGNFTQAGLDDQRNYGIDDRDPEDLAALGEIFAADLADRPAVLACPRLLVTPGDTRARVLTFIGAAQTTLELEVYYLSDSSVRAAVIAAQNRGVAVRVLLADVGEMPDNAATANTLKAAGIAVRTLSNPVVHSKLVIVDGTAALIGSNNMSIASLRENREVGAIVRDASTVTPVKSQFEADWTRATPW